MERMFIVICSKNYFARLRFVRTVGCVRDSVSRSIIVCPHCQLCARFSEQERYCLSARSGVCESQGAGELL
jgi:hypothetical protein